jgi:hypothetical protein
VYGLVAAASPVVFLAALGVLGSGRGRVNGTVFLVAFVAGQSLAVALAVALGTAANLDQRGSSDALAAVEIVLGAALIAFGWPGHRSTPPAATGRGGSEQLFARLDRVTPSVALGVGLPLGIGVKRLTITLLAAASIVVAALPRSEAAALGILYVAVATSVVWLPVGGYLLLGERALTILAASRRWVTGHERTLMVGLALVFGAYLVVDGALKLVS